MLFLLLILDHDVVQFFLCTILRLYSLISVAVQSFLIFIPNSWMSYVLTNGCVMKSEKLQNFQTHVKKDWIFSQF